MLGVRLLARTGIIFLLLGALIGPYGFAIIDANALQHLAPVVVVGLGWVGLLYGSHLEVRRLRRLPMRLYRLVFTESLVTLLVVGLSLGLLHEALGLSSPELVSTAVAAMILAATAAGTAPASLFLLRRERSVRGPTYEAMRFATALDDLPALFLVGIAFSLAGPISAGQWFLLQSALGVAFGLILKALLRHDLDEQAAGLVFFGLLGVSSGICAYLHLSPLWVNALAGATFVNLADHDQRESFYAALARREHVCYVLLLLLIGCSWNFHAAGVALPVAAYLLTRSTGKVLGGFLASRLMDDGKVHPWLGLGLLSQGGMAIAIVTNYHWTFRDEASQKVVSVVLLAVLVNELVAPWAALQALRRAREAR